ncbi:Protein kinase STUNTED [Linum perenne]
MGAFHFQRNCPTSSMKQNQCLPFLCSSSSSSSNEPLLRKMVSCFLPISCNGGGEEDDGRTEHGNKAWLLSEITNAEPQSVHSSFRFSFCSQLELEESMNVSSSDDAPATVLMMNLNNKVQSPERSISPVASSLIRFRYSEILAATSNFSQGKVLGRGALSFVYRGRLGFLRANSVAVKKLEKEDKESSKAFCRELMIASSLHHQNTVPLLGFCIDSEEGLFLVYKYVSGGSLDRHLHDKKRGGIKGSSCSSALSWPVRYKVAIGVAEAIAYLHNGTDRCIVHRDIKPSNILLTSKKIPKLCDFGLATWTSSPCVPFLCKTVKGTFGYLAPEYFQHGKVSDKTDVYAFGVVLLELITGRKPIEASRPSGEENLVQWAKPLLDKGKGAITELLDPHLSSPSRNIRQITQTIQAAAACLTTEDSRRPQIDEIIAILRGDDNKEVLTSSPAWCSSGRKKSSSSSLSSNPISNEMKGHLALAMLGVSELEDEHQLYCR